MRRHLFFFPFLIFFFTFPPLLSSFPPFLVNNAGIVSGKSFLEVDDSMVERTMAVNSMAHMWLAKKFLVPMMSRNSGHIVTIASAAGLNGVAGLADYCASKFAAFGFDESIRLELQKLKKVRDGRRLLFMLFPSSFFLLQYPYSFFHLLQEHQNDSGLSLLHKHRHVRRSETSLAHSYSHAHSRTRLRCLSNPKSNHFRYPRYLPSLPQPLFFFLLISFSFFSLLLLYLFSLSLSSYLLPSHLFFSSLSSKDVVLRSDFEGHMSCLGNRLVEWCFGYLFEYG
jgi:hypothetical protein